MPCVLLHELDPGPSLCFCVSPENKQGRITHWLMFVPSGPDITTEGTSESCGAFGEAQVENPQQE